MIAISTCSTRVREGIRESAANVNQLVPGAATLPNAVYGVHRGGQNQRSRPRKPPQRGASFGVNAFADYPAGQWLTGFYRTCSDLCAAMGETLDSLFGEEEANIAREALAENENDVKQAR